MPILRSTTRAVRQTSSKPEPPHKLTTIPQPKSSPTSTSDSAESESSTATVRTSPIHALRSLPQRKILEVPLSTKIADLKTVVVEKPCDAVKELLIPPISVPNWAAASAPQPENPDHADADDSPTSESSTGTIKFHSADASPNTSNVNIPSNTTPQHNVNMASMPIEVTDKSTGMTSENGPAIDSVQAMGHDFDIVSNHEDEIEEAEEPDTSNTSPDLPPLRSQVAEDISVMPEANGNVQLTDDHSQMSALKPEDLQQLTAQIECKLRHEFADEIKILKDEIRRLKENLGKQVREMTDTCVQTAMVQAERSARIERIVYSMPVTKKPMPSKSVASPMPPIQPAPSYSSVVGNDRPTSSAQQPPTSQLPAPQHSNGFVKNNVILGDSNLNWTRFKIGRWDPEGKSCKQKCSRARDIKPTIKKLKEENLLSSCKNIVISTGTNDMPHILNDQAMKEWVDIYNEGMAEIRKTYPEAKIHISAITPCREGHILETVMSANAELAAIAADNEANLITCPSLWSYDNHVLTDNVHLNPFGISLLATALKKGLGMERGLKVDHPKPLLPGDRPPRRQAVPQSRSYPYDQRRYDISTPNPTANPLYPIQQQTKPQPQTSRQSFPDTFAGTNPFRNLAPHNREFQYGNHYGYAGGFEPSQLYDILNYIIPPMQNALNKMGGGFDSNVTKSTPVRDRQ